MRFIVLVVAFVGFGHATAAETSLFNGKIFDGWEGDTEKTWRIEDGLTTGGSLDVVVPRNEFL